MALTKAELRACAVVERLARGVGVNCQIIFTLRGVEIAPLAAAGSTTADTLAKAMTEALHEYEEDTRG